MARAQDTYLHFGSGTDGSSTLPAWNDLPATAEGATNGEAGKGRSTDYAYQIGAQEETPIFTAGVGYGAGGPYGSGATTISVLRGGGADEPVWVCVNGVSYNLVPGTATTVPLIVQTILTQSGIPWA